MAAKDFTGEGPQDDLQHGTIVALQVVKGVLATGNTQALPPIISANWQGFVAEIDSRRTKAVGA